MSLDFFIDLIEPTSDFQTAITFLLVDKNTSCGYSFFNWIISNIWVTKLSGFAENFVF